MTTESLANNTPFTGPSFTLRNRIKRQLWNLVYVLFFRSSPRIMHGWRRFLLRCFGAKLGKCNVYPKATIWAPWNLRCGDRVGIADGAIIYNTSLLSVEDHATISQEAYICGATHDYEQPGFPLISFEMIIGRYAWIAARASVLPGVRVGDGAVLALGSVATKDMEPWTIYAGVPARSLKPRKIIN